MTADIDDEIRREFVAGPVRQADTVWEIGLRLVLRTDTHIGAATATAPHAAVSGIDRMVDRDPRTGGPRLRATTLAGLLRHHLADTLGRGPKGEDPDGVDALFGRIEQRETAGRPGGPPTPQRAEDRPVMSVLDVDDATGELPWTTGADGDPSREGPAIRTGTRVNARSGAAEAGKFWQMEVLPAGTSFTACLRLQLRRRDHDEFAMLALLTRAADGLAEDGPGVRLGARAGRGLGAVRAEAWSARRHDLLTPEGWAGYYARPWARRWQDAAAALAAHDGGLRAAIARALGDAGLSGYHAALDALPADRRRRAELHLTLAVGERPTGGFLGVGNGSGPERGDAPRPGAILVGDLPRGAARDAEADRAHRMRPAVAGDGTVADRPMLGDTALFALFKRIARRTVRDLGGDADGAWCRRWWGSEPEADTPDRASVPARVALREAPPIDGGEPLPATRTTVDALFGDTVDGRLFTVRAWAGGASSFVLDVRDADDAVCALLVLVARELHTVPFDAVGGGAGVGHGRVAATAATLVRFGPQEPDELDVTAVLRDPGHERRAELQGWLRALHQAVQDDQGTTEAVA